MPKKDEFLPFVRILPVRMDNGEVSVLTSDQERAAQEAASLARQYGWKLVTRDVPEWAAPRNAIISVARPLGRTQFFLVQMAQ